MEGGEVLKDRRKKRKTEGRKMRAEEEEEAD